MFTRQHYTEVAKLIAEASIPEKLKLALAVKFANWFLADNSRFDRDKFTQVVLGKMK